MRPRGKTTTPKVWYCADFETNTAPETVAANPVWAWGLAPIEATEQEQVEVGTSIDTFVQRLAQFRVSTGIYFHNSKFDCSFILNWLLNNGYTAVERTSRQSRHNQEFEVLRANGNIYSLKIAFKHVLVTIWDSAKKIPLRVEAMPKAFGLAEISKGSIDYDQYREPGHVLTEQERDYLCRDILICCESLSKLHSLGVSDTKMTIGSDAYSDWRERFTQEFGEQTYKDYFESFTSEEWFFVSEAYQGGITTPNPAIAGKMLRCPGRVYDVNSMYPGVMLYKPLPFGAGVQFSGKPQGGAWVCEFDAIFTLKPDAIPVYRPKHYWQWWPQGVMMRNSWDCSEEPLHVCMTSVDFENLQHHYTITVTNWVGGYYYNLKCGMFDTYIEYWGDMKVQAGKEGNKGLKQVAKYKLNNLYGKFGQKKPLARYLPVLTKDEALGWSAYYEEGAVEEASDKYMPMAAFITAYARSILCEAIRAAGPRFCYADTDSVHITGDEPLEGLDVDDFRFGAWAHESSWTQAVFHRPKAYAELVNGVWDVKLAGCPKEAIKDLDVERDFHFGAVYHPKLVPRQVKGGCILVDVGYQFNERL